MAHPRHGGGGGGRNLNFSPPPVALHFSFPPRSDLGEGPGSPQRDFSRALSRLRCARVCAVLRAGASRSLRYFSAEVPPLPDGFLNRLPPFLPAFSLPAPPFLFAPAPPPRRPPIGPCHCHCRCHRLPPHLLPLRLLRIWLDPFAPHLGCGLGVRPAKSGDVPSLPTTRGCAIARSRGGAMLPLHRRRPGTNVAHLHCRGRPSLPTASSSPSPRRHPGAQGRGAGAGVQPLWCSSSAPPWACHGKPRPLPKAGPPYSPAPP